MFTKNRLKELFNEVVKEIKKSKKDVNIIKIILWILLLFLIFLLIYQIIGNLKSIGFNLFFLSNLSIMIILISILVFMLIIVSKDSNDSIDFFKNFFNLIINKYLLVTLFIILIVLVISTHFLVQGFENKFPFSISTENLAKEYKGIYQFSVKCENLASWHNDFVKGDKLKCIAKLGVNPDFDKIYLSNIRVQEKYPLYKEIENKSCLTYNNECPFSIKLEDIGKNEFEINYYVYNNSENKEIDTSEIGVDAFKRVYYSDIGIDVLSDEKYQDKQMQKISLTLGSIFVLIFTTIIAIKNFKDLVENKEKKINQLKEDLNRRFDRIDQGGIKDSKKILKNIEFQTTEFKKLHTALGKRFKKSRKHKK